MTTNDDGAQIKRPDHEHIKSASLRVDTPKMVGAGLAPRKYFDRITNEIDGKLEVNALARF
jgi:hypothetical protein